MRKKLYAMPPKDATIAQRFNRNILRDDAIHGKMVDEIKFLQERMEQKLVSNGVSLPPYIQPDGMMTPDRDSLIDNLVLEYNKNPDNKEKLLTKAEIEKQVISLYTPKSNINYDIKGISKVVKEFIASAGAYVWNHPDELAFSLAASIATANILPIASYVGVALGYLGAGSRTAVFLGNTISNVVSDMLVIGASEYDKANKKKDTYDFLSEQGREAIGIEDTDIAKETATNTLIGVAINEAINLGTKGIAHTSGFVYRKTAKAFSGESKSLTKTDILQSNKAVKALESIEDINTKLNDFQKNATTEDKVKFIETLQQKNLSSVMSNEQKLKLESDSVRYSKAFLENDSVAIEELLSETSLPVISKESEAIAMEAASNLSGIDVSTVSLDDVSETLKISSKLMNDMTRFRDTSAGFSVSEDSVANFKGILDEHIKNRFSNIYNSSNGESIILKNLVDATGSLIKNDVNPKFSGFSLSDMNGFKIKAQKDAALSFNGSLRMAELSEVLIGSAANRNVLSSNTPFVTVGSYIEQIDSHLNSSLVPKLKELGKSLEDATRGQINSLDVAEFFDVVNGKSSSTRMLGVKNAWDSMVDVIGELGVESGLDLTVKEVYFPNRWSEPKITGKEAEFVLDMLDSVDIPAMQKLTDKEINETFFMEMYKGITNSDKTKSNRVIVMKDGASWKAMHEKYGRLETVEDVIVALNNSAKNKVFSALVGSDNSAYIDTQMNALKKIVINGSPDKSVEFKSKVINRIEVLSDILKNNNPVSEDVPSFVGKFISALIKAKTSGAAFTALFTDRFGTMPTAFQGIGIDSPYIASFKMLGKLTKRELQDLYNISINCTRDASRIAYESLQVRSILNKSRNLAKSLYNFPSKTLDYVAAVDELVSFYTLGSGIARALEKRFTGINSNMRKFLQESGFTEEMWEFLRKVDPSYIHDYKYLGLKSKSTPIMSSKLIDRYIREGKFDKSNITIAKTVRNRLANIETNFVLMSSPRSTFVGRAMAPKSSSAAVKGALMMNHPFTNIAHSVWTHATREAADRFGKNNVAARLIFGGLIYAYVSNFIRYGRGIDFTNPVDVVRAASSISTLGPLDIIAGEIYGYHTSNVSSITGAAKQIFKGDVYKGGVNLIRTFSPYSNFTLIGKGINSYALESWLMLCDPRGAERYEKELARKVRNGEISEFLYLALRPKNLKKVFK